MISLFGISHYSIETYPQGTSIEQIANGSQYILKRLRNVEPSGDIRYHFTILNKDLEPDKIMRNGWSFCSFESNLAYTPTNLRISILDPDNNPFWNYTFKISNESRFFYIREIGISGVNSLLELFVNVSNYNNWLEFLKTRPEVILDEKYNRNQAGEIKQDNGNNKIEIQSLKEELGKLKLENEALKSKLKQLVTIIGKANRILQKLSQKPGK